MEMQKFTLLGYVKYYDEKQQEKLLVTLSSPCTPEMEAKNRVGFNVTKQYLPISVFKKLDKSLIGKPFYLSTGMNNFGQVEIIDLISVG